MKKMMRLDNLKNNNNNNNNFITNYKLRQFTKRKN